MCALQAVEELLWKWHVAMQQLSATMVQLLTLRAKMEAEDLEAQGAAEAVEAEAEGPAPAAAGSMPPREQAEGPDGRSMHGATVTPLPASNSILAAGNAVGSGARALGEALEAEEQEQVAALPTSTRVAEPNDVVIHVPAAAAAAAAPGLRAAPAEGGGTSQPRGIRLLGACCRPADPHAQRMKRERARAKDEEHYLKLAEAAEVGA